MNALNAIELHNSKWLKWRILCDIYIIYHILKWKEMNMSLLQWIFITRQTKEVFVLKLDSGRTF